MRRLAVLAVLCLFSSPVGGAAISNLYSTGVDAVGLPLPDNTIGDPHYSLIQLPPASTSEILVRANGAYPVEPPSGPWLLDNGFSAWIGPNNDPNLHSVEGDYIYRTTFALSAGDIVDISGRWAADNGGIDILLNAVSTGNTTSDPIVGFAQWTAFAIHGMGNAGLNTLDFKVHNYPSSFFPFTTATGLRVEFTAIPEPRSLGLLAVGAGSLLGCVWRCRRPRSLQRG